MSESEGLCGHASLMCPIGAPQWNIFREPVPSCYTLSKMAAADGDDSLYPIAVLIDELRNEDVQVGCVLINV